MAIPLARLEGKYEILEKLQEGGMGAIYKVRHRLLHEVRVVKVLRPHLQDQPDLKTRFLAEARAAIQLSHPNIAQIFDCTVDDDGVAYIVMEFIAGMTLAELLDRGEPVPVPLVLEIARQGLRALGHIHQHRVAHRDVSPDNIMLTRDVDGRPLVKLIDLGIAKDVEGGAALTGAGVFLGKFRYAAPETFETSRQADRRAGDLYSFALVIYELTTGVFPISGDSPSSLIAGHLFRPPLDFAESDPAGRVPEDVRRAVLKALAKSPDQRFADADSFAAALAAGGEPDLRTPEIHRILKLSRDENRPRPALRPPGSTQSRLNLHFGPEPTPAPTADDQTTRMLEPAESLFVATDDETVTRRLAPALTPEISQITKLLDDDDLPTLIPSPKPAGRGPGTGAPALDETLAAIRGLRDAGRAGEALKALNEALNELGPQPALQSLRSELAEALLARDAEEEGSASQTIHVAPEGQVTVRSRRPDRAETPAAELFDPTIRSGSTVVRLPSRERSAPPGERSHRSLVALGLVLVAAFALLVFVLTRERPANEPRTAQIQDVTPVDPRPGALSIDAVPWAEIVSLDRVGPEGAGPESAGTGDGGAGEPPASSRLRVTPVLLSLPPGEYRIVLRYPPTGETETRAVRVDSESRASLRVTLKSLDAKQYFERIGW